MNQRPPGSARPKAASLLTPAARPLLQRQCACGGGDGNCSDCARRKGELQRKPAGDHAIGEVPAAVHQVLQAPGQALGADVRGTMERSFGHDFSNVRVHADPQAARSAHAVDAAAYTVGRDVVFGANQFAPGTAAGQRLLAHELAHVVQQGARPAPGDGLSIGAAGDAHEAQADRAADQVMRGGSAPALGSAGPSLQRAPLTPDAPGLGPQMLPQTRTTASIDVEPGEAISSKHPGLVDLAGQAGDGTGEIEVTASLTEAVKYDTAGQRTQRSTLWSRMTAIRDALVVLGVTPDRIALRAPTSFATSAHGQVSVALRHTTGRAALPGLPGAEPVPFGPRPAPNVPVQPGPAIVPPAGPTLGEMLTLTYGPLTIELPKSIKARLPIALKKGRALVIELEGNVPASFQFKLTLDGLTHVRVSASAGIEYDTDKEVAMGSAGLQIESVKTVCQAVNPEVTRAKITAAGEKLLKAGQEYSATQDTAKLLQVAGALGEMYDAIEKAKAACKQVPRMKLEFGVKGPLGSGETDPAKRQPTTLGPTLTIPF